MTSTQGAGSTPINDGGPAFPGKGVVGYKFDGRYSYSPGHPGDPVEGQLPGMTLRDYFAGQALNGILLGHYGQEAQQDANKAAAWSYEQADAMLAQRERRT